MADEQTPPEVLPFAQVEAPDDFYQEQLIALLNDLAQLATHLRSRGKQTLDMANKFSELAKKDLSQKEFAERQSTMLGYQHSIFHEIAGQIEQVMRRYISEEEA